MLSRHKRLSCTGLPLAHPYKINLTQLLKKIASTNEHRLFSKVNNKKKYPYINVQLLGGCFQFEKYNNLKHNVLKAYSI